MNYLKNNRTVSFVIIVLIYILASVVGIDVYNTLELEWWLNLLVADVVATLVTFAFSIIFKNASVYDPYWSVQPIVILSALAFTNEMNAVRFLLLTAVTIWGVRLTLNWAYTFGDLTHQDWRYTMLQEKTGVFYPFVNLMGIHMVPTLIVYGCTLPAAYAFLYDGIWNMLCVFFFLISVSATIMQGIADFQMHRFRKNKNGTFIRDGLWKYSRHPNYLGEILMWWGIAFSVISVFPDAWYLAFGALANNLLFICVSIPLADGKQSAKPEFDEYKKQTRMLLPLKK